MLDDKSAGPLPPHSEQRGSDVLCGMILRAAVLCCLSVAICASQSAGAKQDEASTKTVNGTAFGPATSLRGVYFTNFENTVFTECVDDTSCHDWASKGGARVNCDPAACTDLEKRIRALNGNHDNWGTFAITFVGRHAVAKHAKRFLNDREDAVLIERIVSFRLINGLSTAGRPPARVAAFHQFSALRAV